MRILPTSLEDLKVLRDGVMHEAETAYNNLRRSSSGGSVMSAYATQLSALSAYAAVLRDEIADKEAEVSDGPAPDRLTQERLGNYGGAFSRITGATR